MYISWVIIETRTLFSRVSSCVMSCFNLYVLTTQNHLAYIRKDNVDQLGKIISVLGTADLLSYIAKCNVKVTPEIRQVIAKYTLRGGKKRPWLSLLPKGCPVPSEEGIDLLSKLLVYDHDARLTAQQAMRHVFFDPVRERVMAEVSSRSVLEESEKESYGAMR